MGQKHVNFLFLICFPGFAVSQAKPQKSCRRQTDLKGHIDNCVQMSKKALKKYENVSFLFFFTVWYFLIVGSVILGF